MPRGSKPRKTCPAGHPYTGSNVGYNARTDGKPPNRYCRTCRNEDQRRRRAARAAEKLARGCERCGYNRCAAALHWHHCDPTTKAFQISREPRAAPDRLRREMEKCVVLCANCHAEVHTDV